MQQLGDSRFKPPVLHEHSRPADRSTAAAQNKQRKQKPVAAHNHEVGRMGAFYLELKNTGNDS